MHHGWVVRPGLLGRVDGRMRLPLCPPDAAGLDALRASLRRHGLLDG